MTDSLAAVLILACTCNSFVMGSVLIARCLLAMLHAEQPTGSFKSVTAAVVSESVGFAATTAAVHLLRHVIGAR